MMKILSISFSLATLLVVFFFLDFESLIAALNSVNLIAFSISLVFFIVSYMLKAIRINWAAADYQTSFLASFSITSRYGAINYFFPFGIGEVSLPFLLKSKYKISIKNSSAIYLVIRFFDIAILLMVLLLLAFLNINLMVFLQDNEISNIILVTMLIVTLLVLSIAYFGRSLIQSYLGSIVRKLNLKLFVISIMIWATIVLYFYFLSFSVNASYSLQTILIISVISVPLMMSPAKGVGSIGAHEAAWYLGAKISGVESSEALSNAISTHLLLTILVLTALIMSYIFNEKGCRMLKRLAMKYHPR